MTTEELLTKSYGSHSVRAFQIHSSPADLSGWFGRLDKFQGETPAWAQNEWQAGFECMMESAR